MWIQSFVHGVSDFGTFLAYMLISYGVFFFGKKRPRHKKLLNLFTAFIFSCGITHLFHVLFSPRLFDSQLVVAGITAINAYFSIWTATYVYPLLPRLMASQTQEEVEDLIIVRTQELTNEIQRRTEVENHLRIVSNFRMALSEVNKAIVRITDENKLLIEVRDALIRHGDSNVVICKWSNGSCKQECLNIDCEIDREKNLVITEKDGQVKVFFHIKTFFEDYSFCTQYKKLPEPFAQDYIALLVEVAADLEFALRKIEESVKLQKLERDRQQIQNRLDHASTHDLLTGLPNRIQLANVMVGIVEKCKKFAVLVIDVADFRSINELEGQEFGDKVLVLVSDILKDLPNECFGRLGNDEFLLVTPFESKQQITTFVGQIAADLETPLTVQGRQVSISINVGVSIFPDDGSTYESLLKGANSAVSIAKEQRTRLAFYSESSTGINRHKLQSLLERDIKLHKLGVVYQPQVNMETGEIVGVEVLARWRTEEFGDIAAPVFLQVAEYSGLIVDLGLEILDMACRQWRDWTDRGMPKIRLAVNASAIQMHDCQILGPMLETLKKYGVPHEHFNLELTETVMVRDTSRVESCLDSIRGEGIKVSIDDFGTGYSSLSYLNSLHTDELKIDKSFVDNIVLAGNTVIIKSILKLAEDLKLDTIAEGVETEQQAAALIDLGCKYAQGYLYYRPLSAEDLFLEVIKKNNL